jgi:alpha-ketoglutarate-dependent 2,4-dichlorophenoxyacetate dioxygenase
MPHASETAPRRDIFAWDRLTGPEKEALRGLISVHSYANSRDQIDPQLMTAAERAALPPVR